MQKMKKIKRKIYFYKHVIIEILETLCTICLYLEEQGMRSRPQSKVAHHFTSHFTVLKQYSRDLREEWNE